jgi:coronin-2
MPFKIRSSKYRHVYGNPHKEDVCYKNIKITKNAAHDSAFCAVNPKFVAVVTEECGGGAFIVIPIKHTGRIDINTPKVSGHRGPVLDLKWNPFNDNEIASCSEDTTIKVWQIGDHGLYENLNDWVVDLHGHQRRVGQIEWHPTAENIMLSSGADFQVILWNLEKAEPIRVITCHNDTIQSMSWNRDGSFFATTCKDKKIRLINPRTGAVVAQGEGHQGSKISKCIILGCGTKMFTTGFSRLSERQIGLWNLKDLSKPIQIDVVDCSSGLLIPYYDCESKIVFVAGKGDGNIRYYELTDTDPYIHYLSEYKSSAPQRGLGSMPKRGLDVTKNEIFRFYKLHATGGICEPISMIVPRKSEVFQEDIYPDTPSGIPSLSCDEWIMGENRDPILMSMKDGAVPFMPKIVTYKQLGCPEIGNNYSRSLLNVGGGGNSKQALTSLNRKNSNGSNVAVSQKKRMSNGIDADYRNNLPVAEVQPNTKLVVSSRSAFNKTSSSSSSYSSSPPPSPNQTSKKYACNKFNLSSSKATNGGDVLTANDMPITTSSSSSSSSSEATNRDSSNESMTMMQNGYLIEDTNSYTNNLFQTINTSLNEDGTNNHDLQKQNNHNNNNNTNEEIETSYLTSVSKNPITLRKTESLKLDSVQSIRNRFNRMNNIGSLTR